jgi:broad specificity phosphatase PhoE
MVSHQLPIWTLRRHVEGKRLWHNPTQRQCGLASLTTFTFDDDRVVDVSYQEPAAHLIVAKVARRIDEKAAEA